MKTDKQTKEKVLTLLKEGKKPKEIAEELNVPVKHVYNIKQRNSELLKTAEETVKSETVALQKTQLPAPEDDEDDEDDNEIYICLACGHMWTGPKDEFQETCPACGVEFL